MLPKLFEAEEARPRGPNRLKTYDVVCRWARRARWLRGPPPVRRDCKRGKMLLGVRSALTFPAPLPLVIYVDCWKNNPRNNENGPPSLEDREPFGSRSRRN